MEKASHNTVLPAYGPRRSNHSTSIQTRHDSFAEAGLNELLQRLSEVVATLRSSRLGSSRLRWVFEHGQIHSAQSRDNTIAFVVTNNEPGAAQAVEELFDNQPASVSVEPAVSGEGSVI